MDLDVSCPQWPITSAKNSLVLLLSVDKSTINNLFHGIKGEALENG